MSSRKLMRKVNYMKEINDEVIDIKYARYYLVDCEEYINSDKPK